MSEFRLPYNTTTSNLVTALKETKRYLGTESRVESGKSRFICHAADRILLPFRYVIAVQRLVQSRLGNCTTVESWLACNVKGLNLNHLGVLSYTDTWQPVDPVEVQAYRHRWLDSLIEEFSSE